ncbi:MAG: hypothetical protein ACRDGL_10590 [Candidatus Limnocylindrales bacterium]
MRSAQVWLFGGPSGAGKSRVSYPLGRALGLPVLEVDDIVEALLAMTTPDQQPTLHHWRIHPEAQALETAAIVELQIAVARAIEPALEAVVANHLETDLPAIIEGDYPLPSFAARAAFGSEPADGRVRAVFLDEPDQGWLIRNFAAREPAAGPQVGRATVSRLYGTWLAREAAALRLPVVAARPWDTAMDRVVAAFSGQGSLVATD